MFRRRRRANNNQQTPPPTASDNNSSSSTTVPSSNNIPIATPVVASNIPVATPVHYVQSSRIRQPAARQRPRPTLICHTCRQPIRNERHIHTSRSSDRRYHHQCFICLHCNAPIDPKNDAFCYAKVNNSSGSLNNSSERGDGRDVNDEEHQFHRECFAQHFGWMCVVCEKPLPMIVKFNNNNDNNNAETTTSSSNGSSENGASASNNNNSVAAAAGSGQTTGRSTKVEFLKHPFFDNERMCPHHAKPITRTAIEQQNNPLQQTINEYTTAADNNNGDGCSIRSTTTSEEVLGEIRRCAGCHRFEPLFASPTKHFIDVGDGNTGRCVCLACCRTVVTTADDVQPLWDKVIDFFEGPLGLITSEATLHNEPFAGVTRRDLKNIPIMVVGMEALNDNTRTSGSSHFGSHQIMTRGLCLSEHHSSRYSRENGGGGGSVGVTAILILSGLPSDLTASILAHGKSTLSSNAMLCFHSICDELTDKYLSSNHLYRGNTCLDKAASKLSIY